MKVLKRHIAGTNFDKTPKSTKSIKSTQYFFLSGKLIKLSKFWMKFFKSRLPTLINGTKYHKKSEELVQLKDGHAYYYKKIFIFAKLTLFGETLPSWKNRKVLSFA